MHACDEEVIRWYGHAGMPYNQWKVESEGTGYFVWFSEHDGRNRKTFLFITTDSYKKWKKKNYKMTQIRMN